MALTRKSKTVTADSPASVSQETAEPVQSSGRFSAYVRLINGCSTYVTPDRQVYYAKKPDGKSRIYAVESEAELNKLLGYKDDYDHPFFQQTNMPKNQTAAHTENILDKKPEVPEAAHDPDEDEIDTGTMRLQDENGKPVGVVV